MTFKYSDSTLAFAEAERRVAECKETGGRELDLSNLGLAELPDPVGELKQLTQLWLQNNQLGELPTFVGELKQLEVLYLDANEFRELPSSLGKLKRLEVLRLEDNQLSELPDWFRELKQQYLLYIDGNPELGIPAEVVETRDPRKILNYYLLHHAPASSAIRNSGQIIDPEKSASKLEVFLCHASADKGRVREIYRWLTENGFEPWLDAENLDPGDHWKMEIAKAVKRAHVILVCLSQHSVNKEGFVQKEIKMALDVADEKPEGTIYIIPVRLEECAIPDRLADWHWLNLFEPDGYERLARSLHKRLSQIIGRPPS